MNNKTILIIGLILVLSIYLYTRNTEHFTNGNAIVTGGGNEGNGNANGGNNNEGNANGGNNNEGNGNNGDNEGSNEGSNEGNNGGNEGNNDSNEENGNGNNVVNPINNGNNAVNPINNENNVSVFVDDYNVEYGEQLLSTEIPVDENLDKPEMMLESVGNTKLILHWQNRIPTGLKMSKYTFNVYKCEGIVNDCNRDSAEKITSYTEPSVECRNCYLIVDDLNMAENTYFVEMQIVYQNPQTGQYIITPKEIKNTKQEVEQNLSKMYTDALDHLIESNIQQKEIDMEQQLQKKKIDELRQKITKIKLKLKHNDKYSENMKRIMEPPYPIKTYYTSSDILDPAMPPQQTIRFDDKEYYLGLVTE